jgi:hypothetical protein
LRRSKVAATDDVVAIVAGTRMVTAGSTNFIRLHRIRPVSETSGSNPKKTTPKDSKR